MVTVLAGENGFGLQAELEKLKRQFLADHGDMALERLDGEDASFERIQEALQGLPFLTSRKLVVLRAPSANKQFVEHVERLLRELPEMTDAVLVEPKLDKRSSYYKFLKTSTDFREFGELDENGLARWLVATAKEKGGSLSLADARFLAERVGLSQQILANELEKLMLYEPKITRSTIELLCEPTPQSTIFELLEAAFAGNQARALELYREQREQKVEPAQIIAMLTWQLRVLALIKSAGERSPDGIAREAKLSPFVVRKSQAVATRLSMMRLKQLTSGLLMIDMRSKRESIDLDEALQNYLLLLATR